MCMFVCLCVQVPKEARGAVFSLELQGVSELPDMGPQEESELLVIEPPLQSQEVLLCVSLKLYLSGSPKRED